MIRTSVSIPQSSDFRLYLQTELARRCQSNPKYSLRAFARNLQISPSFLSHLLRGRRSVTERMIHTLGNRLGLGPTEVRSFLAFHQKEPEGVQDEAFNQLTIDQFQMISDWYHYAILELLMVRTFEPSIAWVSRVLGISQAEAQAGIERLMRLGYLAIDEQGVWKNLSGNNTTTGNPFTATAFRNLQKGILHKAIDAVDEIPVEKRDQSSLTMAMDSRLMPELKAEIKAFRRKLCEFQSRSKDIDQVYHVSLSVYPILTETH